MDIDKRDDMGNSNREPIDVKKLFYPTHPTVSVCDATETKSASTTDIFTIDYINRHCWLDGHAPTTYFGKYVFQFVLYLEFQ